MSELKVKNYHGKNVIDSRDVAEMVGKRHDHLLRDIAGYITAMEEESGLPNFGESSGGQLNFQPSDFFIPSTYTNSQNKKMACYLVTKKGCDMIANKLTGKKGVLFTAAYVTAFEEMKQALTAPPKKQIPEGVSLGGLARLLSITRRIMLDMGNSPAEIGVVARGLYETCGIPLHEVFSSQIPGQFCLFERPGLG